MKIVIADDEELIRYDIRAIIEDLDSSISIVEAVNGKDLIAKVQQDQPDAALVDIRMPGTNGLEAIEVLHNIGLTTKFVILTGHAEFDYAKKALQFGVIDYLLKPVNSSDLENVLERLQTAHRNTQDIESDAPEIAVNERITSKTSVMIKQAEELILTHFQEPIGVAQIADILHVTPNYLSAQFKLHKNQSFTSFITEVRLEKSRELLKVPGSSVKSVCQEIGYVSPRHFARLFRQRYGCSPSDYMCIDNA